MRHLKLYEEFSQPEIDEKKDQSEITWKDKGRIEDMVRRASGSETKLMQLAQQMAKTIKDGFKALRRGLAAEDMSYPEVAKVFFDRASELNAAPDEVLPVTKVEDAPKEVEKEVEKVATPDEINVTDVPYKDKPGYQKMFWKDRYNNRLDDDKKEILNDILGGNESLWKIAHKIGIDFDSIKQESIESKFTNATPGYIGRFSGDLRVDYKGSVKLGYPGTTYYRTYTKFLDTSGFW